MLVSRYVSFLQSVQSSSKLPAIFLLNRCLKNLNTVTGRNVKFIENEIGSSSILKIKPSEIKRKLKFCEIDKEDYWKVGFVKEITNIKQNVLELEPDDNRLTTEELNDIINYLVTC